MMTTKGILLISLLLTLSHASHALDMQSTIYSAIMSYPEPKRFKQQAEKYVRELLGKEGVIGVSSVYSLVNKKEIRIPFTNNGIGYIIKTDTVTTSIQLTWSY